MMTRLTICALAALAGVAAGLGQDKEKLKTDLKDTVSGDWIYDDLNAGFALAKKSGKPMLVVFR